MTQGMEVMAAQNGITWPRHTFLHSCWPGKIVSVPECVSRIHPLHFVGARRPIRDMLVRMRTSHARRPFLALPEACNGGCFPRSRSREARPSAHIIRSAAVGSW